MFNNTKTVAWLVIGVIVLTVASYILLHNKINALSTPSTPEVKDEKQE
ncbi:MAG: hypothetical protein BWY27_01112 [Bacteroidetes bacterium ADurb.Bin234]|nr:MAG: hypothetical protein BWY27_01112 [Bacteroidetes bacterium ADurb.Bin234]